MDGNLAVVCGILVLYYSKKKAGDLIINCTVNIKNDLNNTKYVIWINYPFTL